MSKASTGCVVCQLKNTNAENEQLYQPLARFLACFHSAHVQTPAPPGTGAVLRCGCFASEDLPEWGHGAVHQESVAGPRPAFFRGDMELLPVVGLLGRRLDSHMTLGRSYDGPKPGS